MEKKRTAITTKGQTTIPRAIRERLGVGPGDAIYWEVERGEVRVTAGEPAFFSRLGSIRMGRGSVRADIEKARKERAKRRAS